MFNFKRISLCLLGIALALYSGSCGRKNNSLDGLDDVITNSIGMKLKLIKAGEFMMGSREAGGDEEPVHKVEITKPFYIGVCEVTQEQYEKITGDNPSEFKGPKRPVENITWDDAVLFCEKLSEKEGTKYRLPTEAEWEYACRATSESEYYWGDEMDGDYAWYETNGEEKTHEVGQKKPNAWGLYDMSGNVWEFCSDRYNEDYYKSSPTNDPQGPAEGTTRVLRSGSWKNDQWSCTSAARSNSIRDYPYPDSGFRVVREVK